VDYRSVRSKTVAPSGLSIEADDRCKRKALAANKPFVDRIMQLARKKKATTAQPYLAWLLARKPYIVPIPGTSNVQHLQENLGGSGMVLTTMDLQEIASALSDLTVYGGRMNQEQMKVVEA
jgi:aryl-alcohol dehydrogenase-like predicted oxidoreductase